jgi:hypothetical protein
VLATNLTSAVAALHVVLLGMRERGRGQIALVSSLAGLSPLPDAPAYSASKAGLVMLDCHCGKRWLARALACRSVARVMWLPRWAASIWVVGHEITDNEAARRIVKNALANKRLLVSQPLYGQWRCSRC